MTASLDAALSGMVRQQRNIELIANNLANVNTAGYKRAVVRFQDALDTAEILGYVTGDIPASQVSHLQTSAPGPPIAIAVATPAMLPTPTVAASAVMSAWKCEMSPGESGSWRRMKARCNASGSRRNGRPRSMMVR